jgi:hypothetical protein
MDGWGEKERHHQWPSATQRGMTVEQQYCTIFDVHSSKQILFALLSDEGDEEHVHSDDILCALPLTFAVSTSTLDRLGRAHVSFDDKNEQREDLVSRVVVSLIDQSLNDHKHRRHHHGFDCLSIITML